MATPNLTKGATSLDFEEGLHDTDGIEQVFNDSVHFSIGGISMVESWGDVKNVFDFTTGKMSLAERDALIDFVTDDIVGRKNTFTYTDRDSNAHTVRLVDDKIKYVVNGPNYWIAKLQFEEVIT